VKLRAPATQDQKKYAKKLGLTFPEDITQGDIHLLINTVAPRKDPPPSPRQIEFAKSIGATFDETEITNRYLKALIDETIEERSKAILESNPHIKKDAVIEYQGASYRICLIGTILGERWKMRLSPLAGGGTKVIYVMDLESRAEAD